MTIILLEFKLSTTLPNHYIPLKTLYKQLEKKYLYLIRNPVFLYLIMDLKVHVFKIRINGSSSISKRVKNYLGALYKPTVGRFNTPVELTCPRYFNKKRDYRCSNNASVT